MRDTKKPAKRKSLLQYERELRNWTQADLANELYNLCLTEDEDAEIREINAKMVGSWERGEHLPGPFWRKKLCEVFAKDAAELGLIVKPFATDDASTPSTASSVPQVASQAITPISSLDLADTIFSHTGNIRTIDGPSMNTAYSNYATRETHLATIEQGNDMDRHEFVRGAARFIGATLFIPNDVLNAELLDRFIRAVKKPSTLNEKTLQYLETRTDIYWNDHYDAKLASPDLLSYVADHFQKVTTLLENSLLPTVRTRLCIIASKVAQLIGTLLFDMSDYIRSRKYKQAAIVAAQEANDYELEAVAWGRLSMAWMYDKNIPEALRCIQEARRLAKWSTNVIVHAWLAAVEAEIQAKLGNSENSLNALGQAECIEEKEKSTPDTHRLHFDSPSLIGYQGACYRQLYRPDSIQTHFLLEEARKTLLKALTLSALKQRRPTILADLADIYIQQGEVGEACRLTSEAIDLTAHIQSERNLQRLLILRHNLEPWKITQDVKNLDQQLAPLLLKMV